MGNVTATIQKIVIPTYEIGLPEKNPVFLEKRVYQGSSGKVYPYPVVEHISDRKTDKEYEAVILENEYLQVVILPELGGRIQRAYDKTNQYDFVYYNKVIKPALVGLTGPWISGGIEFNWPQHHRPSTYLPVDYDIAEKAGGAVSVRLHDVDQINGTEVITEITLYPGKAYIEIRGQLYNRTSLPQTFLWWANPAVPVNDHTQSVFPPDVHAVMDHGKRDVSRFPIATGVYYKKDYSEGVDISRYKNIPVPTSYMAEKSKYDFVGGYDYSREAGILHVADHHISPGKKQWTWGCGDFGRAWDRNLTDEDGPYVELMTGVYTDNQPDFTWLKPFEEKTFRQYFMPYKKVGQVKNATVDAAINLTVGKSLTGSAEDIGTVTVYATSVFGEARILVEGGGRVLLDETCGISPTQIFERTFNCEGIEEDKLTVSVQQGGRILVAYRPEKQGIHKLPEPARAAKEPEEIRTNEELYLTGQHLEQYRHATRLPDPYYLEGLKRDPGDSRINNAYGQLLLRRGCFRESEKYFRSAIERLTQRNPNPYNSEAYYLLGLALFLQEKKEEAFDEFYKASWSNEQQEMSFYYMALIRAAAGDDLSALEFVEKSLVKNAHNVKARGLKACLYRRLSREEAAHRQIAENLELYAFDFVSLYEALQWERMASGVKGTESALAVFGRRLRGYAQNYLLCARDYAQFGAYREACDILEMCPADYPMLKYDEALYRRKLGENTRADELVQEGEKCTPDYCFPNRLEDIAVLCSAMEHGGIRKAPYYLGNLYYDKLQYEEAMALWEQAAAHDDSFPTVHRNLALAYYNKRMDKESALAEMEKAFSLNEKDTRVFLELDQLHKKLGWSNDKRGCHLKSHLDLVEQRDDLYIEYLTLLNLDGQEEQAYEKMLHRHFHPWEGGEGKVTTQYRIALLGMARKAIEHQEPEKARELLECALYYPENLGEGKLEGSKDNDIHYYLGLVLKTLGDLEGAERHFHAARQGTDEPAGMMYYNDQPADMILYQGLSWKQAGEKGKANARFYRLIDYGEAHLEDEVQLEYFAVSLPDLSVFDDDYTRRNRAHCCYLIALGNIGLGNKEKAREYLLKTLELEPSHVMGRIYLNELERI